MAAGSASAVPDPPRPSPVITPPKCAVVIDSDTTGLAPHRGDRIVSYAIKLIDGTPSGRYQDLIFNPERLSYPKARRVHGLSDRLLSFQPLFREHASEIVEFLRDADAIIGHNIEFDLQFLDRELSLTGSERPQEPRTICTMHAFRRFLPGEQSSLDSACDWFDISTDERSKHHGALIDANLTAALYQELVLEAVQ
jgi:DNA polymerase III subunit epsilon